MKNRERKAQALVENVRREERARQIAALKLEFFRLWELRRTRQLAGSRYMLVGFGLFVAANLLRAPIADLVATLIGPGYESMAGIMTTVFVVVSLLVIACGVGLAISGFVARFKADGIEIRIAELDPNVRLTSSPAEELGRRIRARMDQKRS